MGRRRETAHHFRSRIPVARRTTGTKHGVGRNGDGAGIYRNSRARTAHAGEVSVVTGSAGQAGSKSTPPSHDHRAMWIALNEPGSVVLDIHRLRRDVAFINATGERRDWFAIEKK